jgi:putative flippase GtrA
MLNLIKKLSKLLKTCHYNFFVLSKETIKQLARYGIAGIFNTLLGLMIVYLLKDHVGIRWANILSFGFGMVTNFITSKKFTFKSEGNTNKQGSYFFIIYLFCFCLSFGTMNLLLWEQSIINHLSSFGRSILPEFIPNLITAKRFLSVTSPEMISTYFGIVIFATFNFSLNKYLTFKKN